MSDIDYDELDRAVSSLKDKPVQAGNTPAPVVPAVNTVPVTTTPQVASVPPAAPKPSSGRFMDVVHPSSDMRPTVVPPRPISREAATIQPPAPSIPPVASASSAPTTTESPFLPGTKVEKRPLGAFTDSMPQEANKPAENTDKPIGNDTPLPPELQDDLLSIETNEDKPEVVPEAPPITPTPDANPVAPVAITQQYVEKANETTPPTTSIFDSSNFHGTVGNKKKKKSGWLVVLWILLLIIIGGGIGAAIYFYVLPLI